MMSWSRCDAELPVPGSTRAACLGEERRDARGMQMPAGESGNAHDDSEPRRDHSNPEEPPLPGQRREREKRDRDCRQRIGKIKLIVAVVQRIIAALITV